MPAPKARVLAGEAAGKHFWWLARRARGAQAGTHSRTLARAPAPVCCAPPRAVQPHHPSRPRGLLSRAACAALCARAVGPQVPSGPSHPRPRAPPAPLRRHVRQQAHGRGDRRATAAVSPRRHE
eukprot:362516-Chlamydomonas_euryale.AAC.1